MLILYAERHQFKAQEVKRKTWYVQPIHEKHETSDHCLRQYEARRPLCWNLSLEKCLSKLSTSWIPTQRCVSPNDCYEAKQ